MRNASSLFSFWENINSKINKVSLKLLLILQIDTSYLFSITLFCEGFVPSEVFICFTKFIMKSNTTLKESAISHAHRAPVRPCSHARHAWMLAWLFALVLSVLRSFPCLYAYLLTWSHIVYACVVKCLCAGVFVCLTCFTFDLAPS